MSRTWGFVSVNELKHSKTISSLVRWSRDVTRWLLCESLTAEMPSKNTSKICFLIAKNILYINLSTDLNVHQLQERPLQCWWQRSQKKNEKAWICKVNKQKSCMLWQKKKDFCGLLILNISREMNSVKCLCVSHSKCDFTLNCDWIYPGIYDVQHLAACYSLYWGSVICWVVQRFRKLCCQSALLFFGSPWQKEGTKTRAILNRISCLLALGLNQQRAICILLSTFSLHCERAQKPIGNVPQLCCWSVTACPAGFCA